MGDRGRVNHVVYLSAPPLAHHRQEQPGGNEQPVLFHRSTVREAQGNESLSDTLARVRTGDTVSMYRVDAWKP